MAFESITGEKQPKFRKTGAPYLEKSDAVLLKAGKKTVIGHIWRYVRDHVDYHSIEHKKGELSFELHDGSWLFGSDVTAWDNVPN